MVDMCWWHKVFIWIKDKNACWGSQLMDMLQSFWFFPPDLQGLTWRLTIIDWMFVSPQQFICLNPSHQYDGIRKWDLWVVIMSWECRPCEWNQCPYKGDCKELPHPFCHDTAWRQLLTTHQRSSCHHTSNLLVPWSWTFQPLDYEKQISVYKPPTSSMVVW